MQTTGNTCDVRGMRSEDAMDQIEDAMQVLNLCQLCQLIMQSSA